MATTNPNAAAPAKATARPSRSRGAAAKATPAKAQPAKAAPKPVDVTTEATAVVEEAQPTRTAYELLPHPDGNTKSYTRWVWPVGAGGTGTIYGDIDATAIRVAVYK